MKLATVTYRGTVRSKRQRAPSDELYRFDGSSVPCESLADARYFEDRPNFSVEYTARGRLAVQVEGAGDDLADAISELEYNLKRSLVATFDIETESQKEDVLEDALEEVAEEMRRDLENQRIRGR